MVQPSAKCLKNWDISSCNHLILQNPRYLFFPKVHLLWKLKCLLNPIWNINCKSLQYFLTKAAKCTGGSLQPGGGEQLRDSLTGIFSQNTGGGQTLAGSLETWKTTGYLVRLTASLCQSGSITAPLLLPIIALAKVETCHQKLIENIVNPITDVTSPLWGGDGDFGSRIRTRI